MNYELTDTEFVKCQKYLFEEVGITLGDRKRHLVIARLSKRLRHHGLDNFSEYFDIAMSSNQEAERQTFLNLLTTNETYFFREAGHFDFMETSILPNYAADSILRVWSAASSTGEEAYSIAMLLTDKLERRSWEVMGSDVSSSVLDVARKAKYGTERIEAIPRDYLRRFCLKGVGPESGTLLIEEGLKKKVSFKQINLIKNLPDIGLFDVIFLRNVLIYFSVETKKAVIESLKRKLKPGGFLFVGHAESLKGFTSSLVQIQPAVYQNVH